MKTIFGTEGGNERVIFCVAFTSTWLALSFYLSVRVQGRYYRLALGPHIRRFAYVGRS